MMKVNVLFFSPCNNTGKSAKVLGAMLANRLFAGYEEADITLPIARSHVYNFGQEDILVIATPVYAGRIPNKILPFFKENIKCRGSLVVPVVTFGNRSFDNALAELAGICIENGGVLAGAAAIVGEHSFSDKLAKDRPDSDDLRDITEYAQRLAEKIENQLGNNDKWIGTESFVSLSLDKIPGDANESEYYKPLGEDGEPKVFLKAHPEVISEKCVHCGRCALVCPMGSVDEKDPAVMTGICIKCQACIKSCYAGAREFRDKAFLSHVRFLEKNHTTKKDNVFIL